MQQKLHKNNNTILQITTTLPFFFFFSSLSFMWVLCKLQWVVLGALLDMGFDYLKSVYSVVRANVKRCTRCLCTFENDVTYQIHYRHVFLLPLLWTYYYHIYICAYIRWRFSFSRHSHVDMTSMVLEIQSGIESQTQVMCGHA